MFSHNQILINPNSYGHVHDVCVKKMCLMYDVCRCIDLKVQLITAVSADLSQKRCTKKVHKHACALKIVFEQRATDFKSGVSWFVAQVVSET